MINWRLVLIIAGMFVVGLSLLVFRDHTRETVLREEVKVDAVIQLGQPQPTPTPAAMPAPKPAVAVKKKIQPAKVARLQAPTMLPVVSTPTVVAAVPGGSQVTRPAWCAGAYDPARGTNFAPCMPRERAGMEVGGDGAGSAGSAAGGDAAGGCR